MTDIMRIRTVLTYGSGGPGLHTAYYIPGTPGGSTADVNDAVGRVRGFFVGIAAQFPSTFSSQTSNSVDILDDLTGSLVGQRSGTAVAIVTGSGGTASAPRAAMLLARLRTNTVRGQRLLKGRWYLGPPKATVLTAGGGVDPVTIAAVDGAGVSLLAAGATTSQLAVWARPVAGGGGQASPVTSLSTWAEVAVLRSRRDA